MRSNSSVCWDENSEFLIHNPWTPFAGGDATQLETIAKDLRKAEVKLAEFYAKATKLNVNEVFIKEFEIDV